MESTTELDPSEGSADEGEEIGKDGEGEEDGTKLGVCGTGDGTGDGSDCKDSVGSADGEELKDSEGVNESVRSGAGA